MRNNTARVGARANGAVAISSYAGFTALADRAASEARQRLLERMPVIAFMVDLGLRVTFVAGGGLEAISRTAEDVVGRDLYEVVGLIDRSERFAEACRSTLAGTPTQLRTGVFGRFYEAFLEPVLGESGTIIGMYVLAVDQTESPRHGPRVAS